MSSPWLTVPLREYEAHMSSAGVQQLHVLSELFATVLHSYRPASVAIVGVAGGNGLEHIDPHVTPKILGVDVNGEYLESVRERYPHLTGLELHAMDLATTVLDLPAVELVHAALFFEHAGTGRALENALSLVSRGGHLSAVLQLPSKSEPGVSPTPFAAIQNLRSHFAFADPEWFCKTLTERGWTLADQTTRPLPSGKGLWMGVFRRD